MPRRLEVRQDHLHRALDRAEVFRDHLQRGAAQRGAARRVRQQFAEDALQFLRVFHLHGGVFVEKRAGDVGEILHVRPEDHRLALRGRLDRVLPADGREAFADEHHRGRLVEKFQLARRVHQQAVQPARRQFACSGKISLRKTNFTPRACSFWPISLQRSKWRGTRIRNNFGNFSRSRRAMSASNNFLAVVRAAGHEDQRVVRHAELAQHRRARRASCVR